MLSLCKTGTLMVPVSRKVTARTLDSRDRPLDTHRRGIEVSLILQAMRDLHPSISTDEVGSEIAKISSCNRWNAFSTSLTSSIDPKLRCAIGKSRLQT